MLYEKAPAKINLTLDVLHKRSDGFHEVEMVMTTVDLADRIWLRSTNDGKITIKTSDYFIPTDQRNLAYQAAKLLMQKYSVTEGVEITIEKSIPVAAGLAGGSSDAAATLRGLNRLWKLGLSNEELAEIGAKIGSDIPFCVYGGTALATGRGEKIQKLVSPPNCWVILVKPAISVSTASIYGNLEIGRYTHPNTQAMIEALENKDYVQMCQTLENVLEPVTMALYPEVVVLKEQMKKFGADSVLMSGSGPTVFGLVENEARVPRIYNGLKGFCREVYAIRMMGE
ncbi:4-(cytidine 5'-diphospho)-2-C-methyl-D-erythritol kinase [Sporosarcina pasteurii]|uniref:4-diphosphocytidyl-2-C-methyl-D-erythritol kinase n=1 Tax=Sporosarcina pasteurii TaxID=1474 RepID=A0A380BAT6_SPOPA|nr:4-(cytidine 5'-diphospho)-2-C-methyl-D-erythritol kinase [Sporosarcina pasteurii]MDS9473298.1 4-(cytidine 5'-diphospho)-2-C-methyl-D-erythritol kinase [Sporosarcina pasteurii]QBQ06528.1 4-(cytidine 5'-diphospho)-2-C-methyl-D-erythritol kinase [Sporosarcina pasteurii]SUI98241.1 4-diphosphocytidyl-2-C-methyl-D-erythritol kinase [Sporosarcina pasteurii]